MTLDSGNIKITVYADIRSGSQDLCKFSLDLLMPMSTCTDIIVFYLLMHELLIDQIDVVSIFFRFIRVR